MSNRSELIAAVKATGSHWFDRGAMAFFNSRVESRDVIPVDRERGLWVFVSSEQQDGAPFRSESEAWEYAGADGEADGLHVVRESMRDVAGREHVWFVVRYPRLFTVHTVNTSAGVSCVDMPESLGGFQGHGTRASAYAAAVAHAEAWHGHRTAYDVR